CAVSVASSVAWSKGWIAHTARASPVAGPSWVFLCHSIEVPWEGSAFCVGVLAAGHACLLWCFSVGVLLLIVFVGRDDLDVAAVRLLVLRASGEQVLQSHGGSFPVVGLRGQLSGSGCDREDVAAGDRDGQDGDDECHEKPWLEDRREHRDLWRGGPGPADHQGEDRAEGHTGGLEGQPDREHGLQADVKWDADD